MIKIVQKQSEMHSVLIEGGSGYFRDEKVPFKGYKL